MFQRDASVRPALGGIRQETKATVGNVDYQVTTIKATLHDHGTDAKATLGQLTP